MNIEEQVVLDQAHLVANHALDFIGHCLSKSTARPALFMGNLLVKLQRNFGNAGSSSNFLTLNRALNRRGFFWLHWCPIARARNHTPCIPTDVARGAH